MNHPVCFDIECLALAESEILHLAPQFEAPANYKDQAKIESHIAGQRLDWLMRAALSPVTGRIVAIGYLYGDALSMRLSDDEPELLREFWSMLVSRYTHQFIGFNIFKFDLPFITRRSWKHGIKLPEQARNGRYWGTQFVDLMETWQLGNRDQTISLENLSKFMGLSGTVGSGKDFATMSRADQEAHLEADLRMTAAIASKLL